MGVCPGNVPKISTIVALLSLLSDGIFAVWVSDVYKDLNRAEFAVDALPPSDLLPLQEGFGSVLEKSLACDTVDLHKIKSIPPAAAKPFILGPIHVTFKAITPLVGLSIRHFSVTRALHRISDGCGLGRGIRIEAVKNVAQQKRFHLIRVQSAFGH